MYISRATNLPLWYCVCSGKLKSPKWKNFKGIQVGRKDQIRLNNLIWREWHMQCNFVFFYSYVSELKIVSKILQSGSILWTFILVCVFFLYFFPYYMCYLAVLKQWLIDWLWFIHSFINSFIHSCNYFLFNFCI